MKDSLTRMALLFFVLAAAFIIALFCAGCGNPRTVVEIPGDTPDKTLRFLQDGLAENPSTVTVEEPPAGFWMDAEAGKGKPDFSFPAGSVSGFRMDAEAGKGKPDFSFPAGSVSGGRRITITGPQAFKPPAPPSQKEVAEGNAVYIAIACVLAGIVIAGALAYFGFRHEAFWAAAGGFACAAAVRFISNEVALYVAGAVAVLIGILMWAWYRVRDRVPVEHGGKLRPK